MDRWRNKVAIVTGASAGIGAAIAEKLTEEGLQVVGLARRSERVEELAKKLSGKKGKLYAVKADVSKEEDILNAFKWATNNLGPVHILINNAGIIQHTNLVEGDTEKWMKVLDTNVLGLCIATREAVKIMRANKIDGHIIHINSVVGHMVPNFPNVNLYPASKHAVTALTETLRQEFNHLGVKIKITSISPGAVATEFIEASDTEMDSKMKEAIKNLPMLKAEDIADSVLYVLSTPAHVQSSNGNNMVLSMDRWRGKVAIVTGASAGIGAAIAEKLVEEGLQVVGLARRSERVAELSKKLSGKKGKLHAIKADVSKEEDILNAFKWVTDNLGPIHILINNAGIIQQTSLVEGDTEKWRKVLDTNVLGLCIATREAVKIMRANNIDGHIIHINSIAGHKVPNIPAVNVYPASKHAVTALTETLRQEFNRIGVKIKITSVSPGGVLTEILQTNAFKINSTMMDMSKSVPMLKAEDIVDSVMYVLSTPLHVQVHELIIKPLGENV